MVGLRYQDIQNKPNEMVAMTTLTIDEFTILVAPFEQSFQNYMSKWCLNGKARVGRHYLT